MSTLKSNFSVFAKQTRLSLKRVSLKHDSPCVGKPFVVNEM